MNQEAFGTQWALTASRIIYQSTNNGRTWKIPKLKKSDPRTVNSEPPSGGFSLAQDIKPDSGNPNRMVNGVPHSAWAEFHYPEPPQRLPDISLFVLGRSETKTPIFPSGSSRSYRRCVAPLTPPTNQPERLSLVSGLVPVCAGHGCSPERATRRWLGFLRPGIQAFRQFLRALCNLSCKLLRFLRLERS